MPDLSGLSLDVEADIDVELDEADENDQELLVSREFNFFTKKLPKLFVYVGRIE